MDEAKLSLDNVEDICSLVDPLGFEESLSFFEELSSFTFVDLVKLGRLDNVS